MRVRRLAKFAPTLSSLLLLLGLQAGLSTAALAAEMQQSGHLNVRATVPAPPPATAPTIATQNGLNTSKRSPIFVNGSCDVRYGVVLYINGLQISSVPCSPAGKYGAQISLMVGLNRITAKHIDALKQYGPASNLLDIAYVPARPSAAPYIAPGVTGFSPNTMLVSQWLSPNASINVPVRLDFSIVSGTAPFRVKIDWGDGQSDDMMRMDTGAVGMWHSYRLAGTYRVTARVMDRNGIEAQMSAYFVVGGYRPAPVDPPQHEVVVDNLWWPATLFGGWTFSGLWRNRGLIWTQRRKKH